MKYLILAAVLVGAACMTASAAGTHRQTSGTSSSPTYEDARSNASDEEVRVARRAYRAACERHNSVGYCECMTGGMAQALAPSELAVATAAFTGAHVSASAETRAHVEATRSQVDRGCVTFR
ncbi:MAG: hypothetical protein HY054_14280 [Proteobacteria bacterium]|nr:hypothetical protein [Pseudomonadota bacterium]